MSYVRSLSLTFLALVEDGRAGVICANTVVLFVVALAAAGMDAFERHLEGRLPLPCKVERARRR